MVAGPSQAAQKATEGITYISSHWGKIGQLGVGMGCLEPDLLSGAGASNFSMRNICFFAFLYYLIIRIGKNKKIKKYVQIGSGFLLKWRKHDKLRGEH